MQNLGKIIFLVLIANSLSGQTVLVSDINGSGDSNPALMRNVNGTIFFSANDGTNGEALWISDGTDAGTTLVKDIRTGGNGAPANITRLLEVGNSVFFRANDDTSGKEPWFSDGTESGTNRILDINPGAGSSIPNNYINFNGTVYFLATDGTNGAELWTSDGTPSGTSMVSDINPSGNSNPQNLVEFNAQVYFAATNGTNGFELWRSDGTDAGTTQVLDINSGANSSFPKFLTDVNGTLFFQADDGTNGIELWTSDGTGAGTSLVTNINAAGSAFIRFITDLNGSAVFQADDGINGAELWISDGTAGGTSMVLDINPGGSSTPENLIVAGGILYFTADDGSNGIELWRSDGTGAGTFMVSDINTSGSSNPDNLTDVNGALYFSADDGVNGEELWKTNGTSGGTQMVDDINTSGSSSPAHFTVRNSVVYFAATEAVNGNELRSTVLNQATGLQVTGTGSNSIDLSWTNGSGTGRIVVAREGGATYREPVDGVDYTASANFGEGSNIGGAHYVVFDGTGQNVTVTGLNATTTYYFTVFEYVGTGSEIDYITAGKENVSGTTSGASEPTTIASNMVFSETTTTSYRVTWNNTGDGARRVVVARRGAAVTKVPTDGVTYNANNVFAGGGSNLGGQQYVVFDGTGDNFVLSGLDPSTTYHLAVFEYNGTGGNENYLTSQSLTGSQATDAPIVSEPTTIASNMVFSEISTTSYRVTWNNTGDGARRIVVARRGAMITKVPTDGVTYNANNVFAGGGSNLGGQQYVVFDGTGDSFVLSGLEFSTTYHLAVFEYNGTGGTENYLTSISLTGSQLTAGISEPTTIASNMTFGTITSSSIEVNWNNTGDGARRIAVARRNAPVSRFPQDGATYNFSNVFAGGGSNLGGAQYVVFDGTGSSFTLSGLDASTTYYIAVFEYNGTGGNENYLTSTYLENFATTGSGGLGSRKKQLSLDEKGENFNVVVQQSSNEIEVQLHGAKYSGSLVTVFDLNGKLLGSRTSATGTYNSITFGRTILGPQKVFILRITTYEGTETRKYYVAN